MMACFRANWEEFYGEVLLLDDRRITLKAEQGIKKSSKAAAILQLVFSHLNLIEVEFFGLRFCDKKQQTLWLDPSKTLSQHRELLGPPYIFYFGVKFYVEDPLKLTEETTRYQFYLQLRQDVRRGRLPCPAHLRARLFALMLQAEQDQRGKVAQLDCDENKDVQDILQTLSGVSPPQAQRLLLSLCSSLQMFGVSLFAAYGENQTEYLLGPTPVGVVIYKNKVLVGKYFWQRITKLHFKDETFQLRVVGKNGSETSFFFHTSDRSVCKRLWRCCVEHHVFFRMTNPSIYKLRHNSVSRSPTLTLPNNNKTRETRRDDDGDEVNNDANQTTSLTSEPMRMQVAPPAVQRSKVMVEQEHGMPCAPWESGAPVSGLFNPKFPPNAKEKQDGGKPPKRSRSLDGDRPIRQQRTRSHSHGNKSSGSESERTTSNTEGIAKNRIGRQGNRRPNAASRHRVRSCSPDTLTWKHIQKQPVEPDGLIDRQTEEIPYKEIRVSGEPMRNHRSGRRRRHHKWALTSDLQSKSEMVAPLPVTTATSLPVDNFPPV